MRDDAPRCVMIAIGYTEEVEAGPETSISLNSEWRRRRRRKQVELLLSISSRDPRKSSWKKTTTHCWMCYRSPLRVLLLLYVPSTLPPMDIREEKKRISRTFFLLVPPAAAAAAAAAGGELNSGRGVHLTRTCGFVQ